VANFDSDDVSVLLANGYGRFQSAVHYDSDLAPTSVAIDDMNGDDYLDLIVANASGGNISVLLGIGDGSFHIPMNYSYSGGLMSVATGDLNRDTKPDIAVTCGGFPPWWCASVAVLLGNGDGSFRSAGSYRVGERPSSVAIGDLNGDGHLDLAVANWNSSSVSVLLGYGDGNFRNAVYYDAGEWPSSVAIGDLNGDDHLDLAVANRGSNNVSIFINTGLASIIDLLYSAVPPCRIVDTRKTSAGIIGASTERDFHVLGESSTISAQGGNPAGCPSPGGAPYAAHKFNTRYWIQNWNDHPSQC
jgi:hypothetical protein